MIASNDTIILYKPSYHITPKIVSLIVEIAQKTGEVNALHLYKPSAELRKKNRIKTIQSSLAIEGNTLTIEQVTDIIDHKRVLAPAKDIAELKNAIGIYSQLHQLNVYSIRDFNHAHAILLKGLVKQAGVFRTKGVGIAKGHKITHVAPPANMVKGLMKQLFSYAVKHEDHLLIKSCVFHYELEFIHPFEDGNGRMGRLWQTLLLMKFSPVFEFLPVESIVRQKQKQYYKALSDCDKAGESTLFIEFMLGIILLALVELLQNRPSAYLPENRISLYQEIVGRAPFTRKDYMKHFKTLSQATASRDLKKATDEGLISKAGDKRTTQYAFK